MQSGKVTTTDGLKEIIKRLLSETLTESVHCSKVLDNGHKLHFAKIHSAGDHIDNAEKLNRILLNHDAKLIIQIIAEIIIEGPEKKMTDRFKERITSYDALCIYQQALDAIPHIKIRKSFCLFKRLHIIAKGAALEDPKNNIESICNILITLKTNKERIAHSTIRKYMDTVDNDKKQECMQLAILALEELLSGDITAKRIITALQKINASLEANSQLTANSYFSKPGKTHSAINEAYMNLFDILNNLKGEEFKIYFSPDI